MLQKYIQQSIKKYEVNIIYLIDLQKNIHQKNKMLVDQNKQIPNTKEWQQQQLISQSQVTLVKFDSDLSQNGQQPTLNHLLQKYSIQQRVNFVINRDKGQIIDINNGKVIQRFGKHTSFKQISQPKDNHHINLNDHHHHQQYKYQSDKNIHITNLNQQPKKTKTNSIKSIPYKKQQADYLQIDQMPTNVWDDYWQQSQKIHQKLLMSICQKNNKLLSQLFNKKLNHVPININYKSFDNWTPIHFAALHGNNYALQLLLSMPQLYINSLTNFKLSALHVAVKNNKFDSVRLLLKHGIQYNYQDQDGNTALHYAAQLGHKDIVNLLLNQDKINITLKNNKGSLPKDMATSNDVIKIFLSADKNNANQGAGGGGGGFFASLRNNRQIQKLLMKVNQNQNKTIKIQEQQRVSPLKKKQSQNSNSTNKKPEGKKQNIARMYQLLKQKKSAERIGLQAFKFYKKIGQGAFGEVYIVKKGISDKLYALKAIKKQKILGTNIMRYIQTQKQVLSLIRHPFIVSLHYAFQTQAYLFLVMDYCEGGDLGKSLQRNKKFDEQTVKYYAAQILLALQALHKQKIIYRDLKPDNIVLDQNGHALLTDFGLSKKTSCIDDINKSFCGTPAYLPLQIINKKGHNRMADWYEYGVVLYELYTGIPPFYADTRAELYQNVRAGIIRFPRGTPQPFRDIIKKLLSQNPEKRLGYVQDAQSVKQHPWFEGINWQDVYQKKLPMPKITNKVILGDPIKSKFIEQRSEKHLVSDWSFIAS